VNRKNQFLAAEVEFGALWKLKPQSLEVKVFAFGKFMGKISGWINLTLIRTIEISQN